MSRTFRVALAQLNPTVGDFAANLHRMRAALEVAERDGAQLVVYPELAIPGYPPRDLLDRPAFVAAAERTLDSFVAAIPRGLTAIVGSIERRAASMGRLLHNAAYVVTRGNIEAVVRKRLLPTYDVFDEDRYFEPGAAAAPVSIAGVRVGISICEDIWNVDDGLALRRYAARPIEDLVAAGIDVLLNLSASPFTREKFRGRAAMLSEVARRAGVPLVFVNQAGGHDELVFDGGSRVFMPNGTASAPLRTFDAETRVVEVFAAGADVAAHGGERDEAAAVLDALEAGTRDYARKCGFAGAVLGLSGGIDSALTACIAARALGRENVLGVAMPTRYSSEGSLRDAEALASALGIAYRVIDIDPMFQRAIDSLTAHVDALGEPSATDVTWENVQSRIRCLTLMAISNRTGKLVLTTGNKSELAVGYATLYGDMAGGLAVIGDLPKTFVYTLARALNEREGAEVIPRATIEKPPSAELRPDQTDQDSLPPYDVLDAVLERYVERVESADEIVAAGFDRALVERVIRLVHGAEYKRRQAAPALIVSRKAFGPGRRIPLAQRFR